MYILNPYKNFDGTTAYGITRTSDGASIPQDLSNLDYQAYLNWVAEGNVAETAA